jgi:hypothetical protein
VGLEVTEAADLSILKVGDVQRWLFGVFEFIPKMFLAPDYEGLGREGMLLTLLLR